AAEPVPLRFEQHPSGRLRRIGNGRRRFREHRRGDLVAHGTILARPPLRRKGVPCSLGSTWAIPQIVFVTVRPEHVQSFADLFGMLSSLAALAGTLGLGILAIVLAVQQRPDGVEVYRSAHNAQRNVRSWRE